MNSDKAFIGNKIYYWFTKTNAHHFLLWLVYFAFYAYFFRPGQTESQILINSAVAIVVHASVSYFNIYFLFPNFLRKKNYILYFVALALSISLGAFILSGAFAFLNSTSVDDEAALLSFAFIGNQAIGIAYTTAITMSLKLVKHWYENERLTKDLERLNTETELKYLKSQINPHFLFNSLNSIYSLSLKKSDLAPDLILKLSDILRYILYEGSEKKVSLSQEVKYLQSYLELEKIRHGDRMSLDIQVRGDLGQYEIAPMLLIPFVENSFKHGLGKDVAKGFVKVDLNADNNVLNFEISNSKPKNGMEISKQQGYTGGIGLVNVKKRLNLLYPNKHVLNVGEENDRFKVSLTLNLN